MVPVDHALGDPDARALRQALSERDWPRSSDILARLDHPDDLAFYLTVAGRTPGVGEWIDAVATAEPSSTLPMLVRGCHAYYRAWEVRGNDSARNVDHTRLQDFFDQLAVAENSFADVAARDSDDTCARAFLVGTGRGRHLSRPEVGHRFTEVMRRHPHHVLAHEFMLRYLSVNWFGTAEDMFAFACGEVAKSPPGSTLGGLVALAHIEKWLSLPDGVDDAYLCSGEVVDQLRMAARQSVDHPHFARRPGWQATVNLFAFAFSQAGDHESAARQFDALGDAFSQWPWSLLDDDPHAAFIAHRDGVLARRG